MATTIDLNADLGEGGSQDAALLKIVSSCNVACGGHAGNLDSMRKTVATALRYGVSVGAHPGYPDRENFGRRSGFIRGRALHDSLQQQLRELLEVAQSLGARLAHVKPHGALYNDAATDAKLAATVVDAIAAAAPGVALVGPPDSALEDAAAAAGTVYIVEAFVDRAYRADGRLVSRSEVGAVHADTERMIEQAVGIAIDGTVRCAGGERIRLHADTLCIHGDTANAAAAAQSVRRALESAGVTIHARRH